jgi:hypothetical protein
MPILRLSAAERGGIQLPGAEYATGAYFGHLVRFLVASGLTATEVPPDAIDNITPPYLESGNEYWLLTPGGIARPESAQLHIRTPSTVEPARLLDVNTGRSLTGQRVLTIPEQTVAFPLASATASGGLVLHELVVHSGVEELRGLAIPVQNG